MLSGQQEQQLHTTSPIWPCATRIPRDAHGAFFDWVNVGVSHSRDPRGSPFQMPARLADGLGLESDLGCGYPQPCAPSSSRVPITRKRVNQETPAEEFGFPASGPQEGRLT